MGRCHKPVVAYYGRPAHESLPLLLLQQHGGPWLAKRIGPKIFWYKNPFQLNFNPDFHLFPPTIFFNDDRRVVLRGGAK